MTEKVLVTGGTGFIGQNLVRALLDQGHTVRILVRPETIHHRPVVQELQAQGAEIAPGNVLNPQSIQPALRGVTAVYHLAGRLHSPRVPAEEYERLHIDGTQNVLRASARQRTPPTIVHVSTTGVMGPANGTPLDESAPLRPGNAYEATKAAGEQLAVEAAQRDGLRVIVARPALVYGPGDLHLLGWFQAIQRNLYRVIGAGDNRMHPIFIDDCVEGLLCCRYNPQTAGQVFNIVGEHAVTVRELAEAIARTVARPLPRQHLPHRLTRMAVGVLEAVPGIPTERLPLTRSRVDFMTQNWWYSGRRAFETLGFRPKVDLETGLRRTVEWYRENNLL